MTLGGRRRPDASADRRPDRSPVPARQIATRAPGRPARGFVEPLVTDRLVLRPWLVEDAAEALGIYGRPDVARWLSPEMDHVPTWPRCGCCCSSGSMGGCWAGRSLSPVAAAPVAAAAGSGGPRGRLAAPSASAGSRLRQ